jgi:hypothetical protein
MSVRLSFESTKVSSSSAIVSSFSVGAGSSAGSGVGFGGSAGFGAGFGVGFGMGGAGVGGKRLVMVLMSSSSVVTMLLGMPLFFAPPLVLLLETVILQAERPNANKNEQNNLYLLVQVVFRRI